MEYKLLGTVNVPEEKKAELNEYVLAALYKGGWILLIKESLKTEDVRV